MPRKEEPMSQNSFAPAGGNDTQVAQLSRQISALQDELLRNQFKDQLAGLKSQGYEFDINTELSDIMASPPDMRPRALDRISKNYRKAPINSGLHPAILNSETSGNQGERTPEQRDAIVKLARRKGISYEAAADEMSVAIPGKENK